MKTTLVAAFALEFPVLVHQTDLNRFTVEYGAQKRSSLPYSEAAHELGENIFHALACAGALDNRSRTEAREAGDTAPHIAGQPVRLGKVQLPPAERPETAQERARRLVNQEVCYCVSSLIYAAVQNFEHATALGFDEDDLYRLASREPDADDYSDVAPSSLQVAADGDSFKWKDGEGMWSPPFDSKLEAYRDAFDDLGLDRPDGSEIFEHWIVSDWLAGKLEEHGESIVRDALGMTIWGRATTGQAIYIDYVIEQIVRELHAPEPAAPAIEEER